jgi:hypothetical protein
VKSASVRASHTRSAIAALIALLVAIAGPLLVVSPPATAGPVDVGWGATGTGTVATVSDGTLSAATFTYDATGVFSGSWDFVAPATPTSAAGPIKVPWTWQGLHAWFMVTARLDTIVNGAVVGSALVNAGPTSCCTTPSNGFLYGGVATFNVSPGDTYGFRLSGSNSDFNNFLRGTFTLSTKPYLDATIGSDNRQWIGADDLPAGARPTGGAAGKIVESDEARWYRFPVVPGQTVTVKMASPPADYDLALYGDIEAAFQRLSTSSDVTQLAAASAAGAPGADTQVPQYVDAVTDIPKTAGDLSTTTFAPRIYAPRIYAPRIYAPRIYAPRIYAPRIYAPRIYAPDSYVPDLASDPAFRDAFSAAQNQTLLAVSSNTEEGTETVTASTGNTDGFFYVRVQGHTDTDFDADVPFELTRTTTGDADCEGLESFSGLDTLGATRTNAATVIVTDTNKLGLTPGTTDYNTYTGELSDLATATDGAVVDVHGSPRVVALQEQVAEHPACPFAMNLVAREIKSIVDSYRNPVIKYVVIAGNDDVIPFFRYPDTSGLGQESQFVPPVLDDSPSNASLKNDQVLSQDAYGARHEVTIGGASVPVPDLAVGRLVETPAEIASTIDHSLHLQAGPNKLPTPQASLVTGYDFLADAAHRVNQVFDEAIPGATSSTLISENGTPPASSWKADDLRAKLFGTQHYDLMYLAGHFSANDTLAADFTTTFDADELEPDGPHATTLTDTLVLSAGCHSGYNIVDDAEVVGQTNPYDWAQRMAQQHAVLIGGTGYQYGDTDFLEYSERLYVDIAQRLREGSADPQAPRTPVAVGAALSLAKQDYLASLGTLAGIDQKAVLQATLYGLPMTQFDAPNRAPIAGGSALASPVAVTSGPGQTLGLSADDLDISTPTTRGEKSANTGAGLPGKLSWLNGDDGVSVQPGVPALPKQVENVTAGTRVLRGVGFRGGDYTDVAGLLPLTGAPAIEGSTPNSTFESPVFWPQKLVTANYFGALGDSGRTSLILTPAQYRVEGPDLFTNTERSYQHMSLRLFYSGTTTSGTGDNKPALATPPSISDVTGAFSNGQVRFSVRATGDPSAGVQQVWVTWTGTGADSGHGRWRSVDLVQSPKDSTRWTGVLQLPQEQSYEGLRFIVQAANGIGAVGMDTADGDGYGVTLEPDVALPTLQLDVQPPGVGSPYGITAQVKDPNGDPFEGQTVAFTVTRGTNTNPLATYSSPSDPSGSVVLDPDGTVPSGPLTVRADLVDGAGTVIRTETTVVNLSAFLLTAEPDGLTARAGTAFTLPATGLQATLMDGTSPVEDWPVTFTVVPAANGAGATFPGGGSSVTVNTGADGVAKAPIPITASPAAGVFKVVVSTDGAPSTTLVWASKYGFGTFGSPVNNGPGVVNGGSGNLPLKFPVLTSTGQAVPDSEASGLVSRVQLRWRAHGTEEAWQAKSGLATYDASANIFQINLKTTSLAMKKGTTYDVEVRILAAGGDPKPGGYDAVAGEFDLGRTTLLVKAEK